MSTAAPSTRRRYLFITHARSASNLLVRMLLSRQDNVLHAEYTFGLEAIDMRHKYILQPFNDLDSDTQRAEWENLEGMRARLRRHFDDAQAKGLVGTDKEHAVFMLRPELHFEDQQDRMGYLAAPAASGRLDAGPPRNDTVLDEAFLRSVTPIFLIRHPALMVPSYARLVEFDRVTDATVSHSRTLYDWYVSDQRSVEGATRDGTTAPIILDAGDFIQDPTVLRRLAAAMGLDPEKVAYDWPAATDEEKAARLPVAVKMTETLAGSTGVLPEKTQASMDVDVEARKWRREFGEEIGGKIELLVSREMRDYEYLKSRRWVLDTR